MVTAICQHQRRSFTYNAKVRAKVGEDKIYATCTISKPQHEKPILNPLPPGIFSCFLRLFFFSGISSECQTVWIQFRPDVLSGLIWV